MTAKITITCDCETLDKISMATKKHLSTPDWTGKPWFKTEKEADDWMGDVFYDAVKYYMNCLGIELIIGDEN